MQTINIVAAAITVVAALVAFIRMWYCMWRETARPNFFTWIVWAILAIALLKSEYEAIGVTWALSLLFNDLACISITAIALSVQAIRNLRKLKDSQVRAGESWARKNSVELGCLAAITAATAVWWQTSSALIALVCYLTIDFVAVVPTLYAVWGDYTVEDLFEWVLFQVANTAVIFTVSEFTFEQLAYPVTVCAIALAVNITRAVSYRRHVRQINKRELSMARAIV